MTSLSIIIPAWNAGESLGPCLEAVLRTSFGDYECIVVDDASTDSTASIAQSFGVRVLRQEKRRGPAHARNAGAEAATGDILLFIDADVCIAPDTVSRVIAAFEQEPSLDAVIGSYDFNPAAPNFVSQYKNLLHAWIHQNSRREASTFWTGCGAIRRRFFLASGGFNEVWSRPSVEDIEYGAAIVRGGARIRLDHQLRVKHLKQWTMAGLLRSDVFDRAIPWTRVLLESGGMPDDLNLRVSQRLCVLLMCLAPLLAVARLPLLAATAVLIVIGCNLRFYQFLAGLRGAGFALRAIPVHLLYFLYSGGAMIAGLALHLFRPAQRSALLRVPLRGVEEETAARVAAAANR